MSNNVTVKIEINGIHYPVSCISGEEERLIKLQEEQFADLDKKLGEVEKNRKDAIRRDIALDEERRSRQAQFTRNMKASAATLNTDDF